MDIQNRNDVEQVIIQFYSRIKADSRLNIFFTEVISVKWEEHIKLMCDFWENVLFHTGEYEGNPLETHKRINAIKNTNPEHFKAWLELFFTSIDSLFTGPNSNRMKEHAAAIAKVMETKLQ